MKKDRTDHSGEPLEELLQRAETADEAQEKDRTPSRRSRLLAHLRADHSAGEDKDNRTLRRLTGWDDDESISLNLKTVFGGDVLAGRWFRRHFFFLSFLVLLAIIYVTNRYAYQKEMIDNRKLILQLEDRRLRAVVATSNLTEYMRRSNISSQLSDTTIKSSPAPFYYLQTD